MARPKTRRRTWVVDGKLHESLDYLEIDHFQGDAIEESAYADLDLTGYQSLVVLADEAAARSDVDTRTLRILLRLDNLPVFRSSIIVINDFFILAIDWQIWIKWWTKIYCILAKAYQHLFSGYIDIVDPLQSYRYLFLRA